MPAPAACAPVFQPMLLAVTRSDTSLMSSLPSVVPFQPTLLAVTRSDGAGAGHRAQPRVSTHAPRGHEERSGLGPRKTWKRFQPTLLAVTRSDSMRPRRSRSRKWFQPTLLAVTRSDGRARGGSEGVPSFQPTLLAVTRSDTPTSARTARRRFQPTLLAVTRSDEPDGPRFHLRQLFQPTLLAVTRSDAESRVQPAGVAGFQPTLLAVTRSDCPPLSPLSPGTCFNPRSSRSRGATSARRGARVRGRFNPRSSRSRGATTLAASSMRLAEFQPTLLAVTRSDVALPPATERPRVSTHAPRGHEERPGRARTPRPSACFNPRSSRSRGATITGLPAGPLSAVSTHAPRGHEERPSSSVPSHAASRLFQPTLLAVTRSDTATPTAGGSHVDSTHAPRGHEERPASPYPRWTCWRFNPRSSRSRGATRRRRNSAFSTRFQPTLLAVTRSDWPASATRRRRRFQPTLLAVTRSDVREV
ncbi:hypothetical protein SAMN05443572_112224 [Myxococcus fulvus]|uniref:Uncharacterized protein n=1 Tax=Myxococcus fulvus TaxID=33 RepID=A0ABY1CTS5_MYXFU|nr:hypothetical protein SAMN05443572_112224 [Myxococcus fulvus]